MNKQLGRVFVIWMVLAMAACTGTPPTVAVPTPTAPAPPTETASPTPQPVDTDAPTPSPSNTPTVPTPTLTFTSTSTPLQAGELFARLGKGILRGYAFSPDGATLAVLTDLGIYLYSTSTMYEKAFIAATGIEQISYRSGGQLQASALQLRWDEQKPPLLTLWQVNNEILEQVAQIESPAWTSSEGSYSYLVSPDGTRLAFLNGPNRRLEVLQTADSSLLGTWDIPAPDQAILPGANDPTFAFSPDSSRVVFCDGFGAGGNITVIHINPDGLIPMFTLSLDEQIAHYADYNYWPSHGNYGIGLAISPDDTLLAVGGPDNKVRVWNMDTGGLAATLADPLTRGVHVAFSPDGKILTVVNGGVLYLYTASNWKLLGYQQRGALERPLTPAGGEVVFSPDSTQAAAAYSDKIYFTNLHNGYRGNMLSGFMGPFWELAISPDGGTLALAGDQIYLYSLPGHALLRTIDASSGSIHKLTFSPDGKFLAATMDFRGEGCDGWAEIWRVEDGAEVQRVELTPAITQHACVGALAYSQTKGWLAIQVKINQDESLTQLWRVNTNGGVTYLRDLLVPGIDWVEFSSDGAYLVSYTGEDEVPADRRGVAALNLTTDVVELTPTDPLYAMHLVPAASVDWLRSLGWVTLAVDGSDRIVVARGGLSIPYMPLQSAPVVQGKSYVISPDMGWVALLGNADDQTDKIWVWGVAGGYLVGTVPGTHAAFSPNGKWLVAIEQDGTVAIWKLK
jgi:WD40 repeat protein